MKLIDVEMQNVKVLCGVADPVQHQHVVGDGIADVRVEPDRGGNAADELRARDRIATGEQGHLVTHPDQLFRQV